MDSVLVLILAFLSTGQSYNEASKQKGNSCSCPPGQYRVGECDDPVAKHRCEKCRNYTFKEKENDDTSCYRCGSCSHYKKTIKSCTLNSNVVCDCIDGYYYQKMSSPDSSDCYPCDCKRCEALYTFPDYIRKCQPCQRCLGVPECKRKCSGTSFPPLTNSSTAASPSTSPRTTISNNTLYPVSELLPHNVNEMSRLFLAVVLVILLLFLWLLLIFASSPFRYSDSCVCWSVNKQLEPPLEDPNCNEQSSHQGSSPNTLILNISENTPMMTLSQSPAVPEPLAHISPQDAELKTTSQHVQSDHWPAIVLYAIIKEVPLRRWKEFLRLLSVTDQQLERVELEAGLGLGSMERQYQMLRLWSQCSSASLNDVFSALQYMDLSGCAQLLQESLENLPFSGPN